MKCKKCGIDKLRKEFPPFNLIRECDVDHSPWHCLRCVTSHWEQYKLCSQCDRPVPESSLNLRKCYNRLEKMFPEITSDLERNAETSAATGDRAESIRVTKLNGESIEITFESSMTIITLKRKISDSFHIDPEKQQLLFKGKILKEFSQTQSKSTTLATYGILPNNTIHLMVLLYAVPTHLDKVVFDLYWGYPQSGRDYLDASAWAFEGQQWVEVVRFVNKELFGGAIRHSGDITDELNEQGHHLINVNLSQIPQNITHIFFSLSSYNSPTISHFRNPSMRFYALDSRKHMLCEDKTNKAGRKKAIIMCSLQKTEQRWCVNGTGALTDGDALCNIRPMLETCQGLIAKTGDFSHVPLQICAMKTNAEQEAAIEARKT